MKIAKYLFVSIIGACISVSSFAQQPNTSISQGGPGAETAPEEMIDVYKRVNVTPDKKPVPYPYLREADVMWAKDLWRIIDLRQRMNYPLRYPETEAIEDRYSLYLLLMKGIESGEITPFASQDFNNPLTEPTTLEVIYNRIEADTVFDDDGNPAEILTNGSNVKGFYIKEKWYFDKQHSEMRVRIYALAPLLITPKIDPVTNQILPGVNRIIPFFVYFPQCRNLLAQYTVYNPNNDAQSLSFDDMFIQRRFASTIAQESNEFGNRFIVDYLTGQDALMEAERIKEELFNMEHDLWEY